MTSERTFEGKEKSVLLIGAGNHAKTVVEALSKAGATIDRYVDPLPCSWLPDVERLESDHEAFEALKRNSVSSMAVIGMGAANLAALAHRLSIARKYAAAGFKFPVITDPSAYISESATLGPGVIVGATAHVGPDATVGFGALINTRAIVEHDAEVGEGAHIAPGSILLGSTRVGSIAFVGAGAIVLPGASIEDGSLLRANGIAGG